MIALFVLDLATAARSRSTLANIGVELLLLLVNGTNL